MNKNASMGGDKLLYFMLAGIVLGVFCGWYFGPAMTSIKFLGDIFLNALKAIIIPLIVSMITVGITSLGDIRRLGTIGGLTIGYYIVSTSIAVIIGVSLCLLIEPGVGVNITGQEQVPDEIKGIVEGEPIGLSELVTSLISSNIVKDMVELDILPILVAVIIFAVVLTTVGKKGEPLIQFFESLEAVMIKIVHVIMYYAPIGVFALIAAALGEKGGGQATLEALQKIGLYTMTVMTGLGLHALIVLPLLLFVLGKRNPFVYMKNMLTAITTAFSTASSAATLPLTIEGVVEKNKVRSETASFVLPIGATVNMDGTALYEAVAAIFIAQAYGVDLGMAQLIIIFLTATLASVGAAAIPHAGLVTMIMVLNAVNLPTEGIYLIFTVDWFLDRCRTAVNIWGDSTGAGVIETILYRKFDQTG